MEIEPTDEDIAEALRIMGYGPNVRTLRLIKTEYCGYYKAHATTLCKLRHAEELLSAQAAQIAVLRETIQRARKAPMIDHRNSANSVYGILEEALASIKDQANG